MQVADLGDNLCKGKSFVNIEKLSFLVHYLSQGKHVNKGWMEANPGSVFINLSQFLQNYRVENI